MEAKPEYTFPISKLGERDIADIRKEFDELQDMIELPAFKSLAFVVKGSHLSREQEDAFFNKNRYTNVLPQIATRVKLTENPSLGAESDYINADYVKLPENKMKYIQTQAPKPSTVGDFWRMILEQNGYVIVMNTDFVDRGSVKAIQYWPDDVLTVAGITVRKVSEDKLTSSGSVIRRTFVVSGNGKELEVKHLHCKTWPDYGAIDDIKDLVSLLQEFHQITSEQPEDHHAVIHCSAGVGRASTFLSIDHLLRIKQTQVNIYEVVRQIRIARGPIAVQTCSQYEFIYSFLNHCITNGLF